MIFLFTLYILLIHYYAFNQATYWKKRFYSTHTMAMQLLKERLEPKI